MKIKSRIEFPELVVGIIVDDFKHNHQMFFKEFGLKPLIISDEFSLFNIIEKGYLAGDRNLVIGDIGNGIILFDMFIYNSDEILQKISKEATVLTFYINKVDDLFVFRLFEKGECVRDNYSDEKYDEIGTPLEIETTNLSKLEIIYELINNSLHTDIQNCGNEKFFIYEKKSSFLSKLFS